MEPPQGFLASLWSLICFLPFFVGLLLLGTIKGIIFCPLVCLIITVGNSAIVLGLWPFHIFWTYYSIIRAKQFGPGLKIVLCLFLPVPLILWLVFSIIGSITGGALYGFLSPVFATFDAVGEGKTNELYHCFVDGTWDSVKKSCIIVRDFGDVCYHSYSSYMHDLQGQQPPDRKYYEIRLLYLPGAIIAGFLGFMLDFPLISLIALCKSPYMLFKGWHRLFHDLIGREGPFLETICVPFAGLAILLWPLAVVGAVLGSMVSSIVLGAYAGVVVYQESSFWFGLCYIVASWAIYDEYSNDILDMPEGSCFPRPRYRKAEGKSTSRAPSFSKRSSFQRADSLTPLLDLKPFMVLDGLFKECRRHGENFLSEGLITAEDLEDARSKKSGTVVSIGLPAYCLLQALLRSVKSNSEGILLSDNTTELTTSNRPKDTFFDWFFNPFIIMKDQIKALNLSEAEEDYLCKLVLLSGDPMKLKTANIGPAPESERRRAELDALARRLQGITRSISRYPTSRRHFQSFVKTLLEDLAKKNGERKSTDGTPALSRSKSAFAVVFQKSFKNKLSFKGSDEKPLPVERDVEIE
ncbi:uncharacterized membrane protein At3g27390 [Manihot esculenta]|uniref:Uncharacterized protein n=1 Tax=Manihot esculenta TaxID=3983 RepID=A0A2C9U7S0_MANES|nr:uncharacterized membrane protein At3g27390 [Manihot esculenta]XP_021598745.1 uncharacterized membrane protein At3g27390 [Manihot esculenta]XP_021598746.1 uncharacterized membrane protein At3g27390 [Manihot esculenta]XP_021598747.1 uncharacterized membrane protein At3g27390 [Manihot esculenta]XP_043808417.1 uncharacterized membrane protein At3g27390 [Manihot esculenta]XP_043808418.1 uncharacterized membrane protein At3g27390 [Manihot esculenta]OAY25614.1 hypothetical protein MANES_17G108700